MNTGEPLDQTVNPRKLRKAVELQPRGLVRLARWMGLRVDGAHPMGLPQIARLVAWRLRKGWRA